MLSIKNVTEATLRLNSNVAANSNDKTNFPHDSLLTNTKNFRLPKAFANGSSANTKEFQKFIFLK